jgi:hypothetical protein
MSTGSSRDHEREKDLYREKVTSTIEVLERLKDIIRWQLDEFLWSFDYRQKVGIKKYVRRIEKRKRMFESKLIRKQESSGKGGKL